MKKIFVLTLALTATSPAIAKDLFKTLAEPAAAIWTTTNHADLKFCVVTSVAAKTGQASTVVEKGADTLVIVHNWSSPVPGDNVRGVLTIKPDGSMEFRGQKDELVEVVKPCASL